MDDPLIGLTIYDTTKAPRSKKSDSSADLTARSCSTDKEKELKSRIDKGEECFPCLPGISEDCENKAAESSCKLDESMDVEVRGDSVATLPTDTNNESPEYNDSRNQLTHPKNYWLMRLFQSHLFDMSIAIGYLFKSKDHDVQSYLGNKLFVSVTIIS